MGRKGKFSQEVKLYHVQRYLNGEDSGPRIAKMLGILDTSFYQWVANYESLGSDGLLTVGKNTGYTVAIKEAAIKDYLSGVGSLKDICKKYGMRSKTQLRDWILKYNSPVKLKASRTGGILIMPKGRKTTYEERIEIVKYCIESQDNYTETAQKYQVSYQQVYDWTRKYAKEGVELLQDRRGKRKSGDVMSEIEKLRAQNKLLEAENTRRQMEIDFLKKLNEIERRRY